MTDQPPDSPSQIEGQERNELRLAWEAKEQNPSNNPERAFHAWKLLREQGVDLLAVRETGELYAYRDGVWSDDGEQVLRERARQMMTSEYSTSVFRELKEQVLADLCLPRGEVAVKNGLLDLRERSLRDLTPEDRALYRHPVAYDPEAECPRWGEFLDQVLSDESGRKQLQEFVGYCLAGGEPWLKKALMIFGPTDAGKTVFLEIVERLFGKDANAAQTPQYLANQRWGVDQLNGMPVNIRHDVDATKLQRLGRLKEIIDGNPVTAEKKGKEPYQFKPEARHLFAANRAPERPVDDKAFWNRWLTVIFPESVPPEEQVPKRQLLSELTDELPGVLNWALDGLDRLRENGGFTDAPGPAEVRRRWEQYGTPVERFKTTGLIKEPGEAVEKERVWRAYIDFCVEHDHQQPTKQQLTRELTKDSRIGESQHRIDGDRKRVYTGICLSNPPTDRGKDSDVVVEGNGFSF